MVITLEAELEQKGAREYITFNQEGNYHCLLDFRSWYNRKGIYGLICYFTDIETGTKYKGFCFRGKGNPKDEIYRPTKTAIDFSKVEDGTYWIVTIIQNKKGKFVFEQAKQVEIVEEKYEG